MKYKKYIIFVFALLAFILSVTNAPPRSSSEVFSMNGIYDKNTPSQEKINSAQFGLDKKYKKIEMILYLYTKSKQKVSFKLTSPSGKILYCKTGNSISETISYNVTPSDRKTVNKKNNYMSYSFILNGSKSKYLDHSIEFIGYK
jgi:hypothetical protein